MYKAGRADGGAHINSAGLLMTTMSRAESELCVNDHSSCIYIYVYMCAIEIHSNSETLFSARS